MIPKVFKAECSSNQHLANACFVLPTVLAAEGSVLCVEKEETTSSAEILAQDKNEQS